MSSNKVKILHILPIVVLLILYTHKWFIRKDLTLNNWDILGAYIFMVSYILSILFDKKEALKIKK